MTDNRQMPALTWICNHCEQEIVDDIDPGMWFCSECAEKFLRALELLGEVAACHHYSLPLATWDAVREITK